MAWFFGIAIFVLVLLGLDGFGDFCSVRPPGCLVEPALVPPTRHRHLHAR